MIIYFSNHRQNKQAPKINITRSKNEFRLLEKLVSTLQLIGYLHNLVGIHHHQ